MKIDLLLFGITKDIIGGNSYKIELPENATVGDLRASLTSEYPKLEKLKSIMVAVNNEYSQDDQQIKETDEIALIPPVSGG